SEGPTDSRAPTVWAVVPAAGRGLRMGQKKQGLLLAGRPVLRWTVEVLEAAPTVQGIVVMVPPEDVAEWESRLADCPKGQGGRAGGAGAQGVGGAGARGGARRRRLGGGPRRGPAVHHPRAGGAGGGGGRAPWRRHRGPAGERDDQARRRRLGRRDDRPRWSVG